MVVGRHCGQRVLLGQGLAQPARVEVQQAVVKIVLAYHRLRCSRRDCRSHLGCGKLHRIRRGALARWRGTARRGRRGASNGIEQQEVVIGLKVKALVRCSATAEQQTIERQHGVVTPHGLDLRQILGVAPQRPARAIERSELGYAGIEVLVELRPQLVEVFHAAERTVQAQQVR
jgi:hypothetical protein